MRSFDRALKKLEGERDRAEQAIAALKVERDHLVAVFESINSRKEATLRKRFTHMFDESAQPGRGLEVVSFSAESVLPERRGQLWMTGEPPSDLPRGADGEILPIETPVVIADENSSMLDRFMAIDGYIHMAWIRMRERRDPAVGDLAAKLDAERKRAGVGKSYLLDPRFQHVVFDASCVNSGFSPPEDMLYPEGYPRPDNDETCD